LLSRSWMRNRTRSNRAGEAEVARLLTHAGAARIRRAARQVDAAASSHLRTRAYRPQTNGKAERFIRTLLPRIGLRARSTAYAANAPPPLTDGFGTTSIDADTQPSATNRPSAEPTCLGLTSRRHAVRASADAPFVRLSRLLGWSRVSAHVCPFGVRWVRGQVSGRDDVALRAHFEQISTRSACP
jgi:hypothetical protein